MCPPSPSAPIATPTPDEVRSRHSSRVFALTRAPVQGAIGTAIGTAGRGSSRGRSGGEVRQKGARAERFVKRALGQRGSSAPRARADDAARHAVEGAVLARRREVDALQGVIAGAGELGYR